MRGKLPYYHVIITTSIVQGSSMHNFINLQVPYWIRGDESATMLKPRIKKLPMLGLGYSVATPPEGIVAEAVVVQNFEELEALPAEQVLNKIVVYDQPYTSYGESGSYRRIGASEASKRGAIAALVRSITPFSLATPHTGMQMYLENVTKIPVAAITHEDADMLWRQQKRGENIVIHLKMSALLETKISRNMVADLKGSDNSKKLVIISGHIDSWDVGDGSMDDAAGCFISWVAPIVLKELNLIPKRTLRTILFTAEEFGVIGAQAYEAQHKEDNEHISFLMESDLGTFAPLGLYYDGSKDGECMMREILKLFVSINATEIILEDPAPDISVWTTQGYPGVGLYTDNPRYFWFHHSDGDTLNVIDPNILDVTAAFWAAVSYIIADMKYDVPRD